MNNASFLPLIISVIALLISLASYRRTKTFQDFDYAPRLQIVNEEIVAGNPSLTDYPAISYKAGIDNRGSKTIRIDTVCLDYGDRSDANKRMKYHIVEEVFLSPGQCHAVSKEITWELVEEMKQRFNIDQCHFFLRVTYHSAENELQETSRALFGFERDRTIFHVQKGNCLT